MKIVRNFAIALLTALLLAPVAVMASPAAPAVAQHAAPSGIKEISTQHKKHHVKKHHAKKHHAKKHHVKKHHVNKTPSSEAAPAASETDAMMPTTESGEPVGQ